jgi:hypothetical protein
MQSDRQTDFDIWSMHFDASWGVELHWPFSGHINYPVSFNRCHTGRWPGGCPKKAAGHGAVEALKQIFQL